MPSEGQAERLRRGAAGAGGGGGRALSAAEQVRSTMRAPAGVLQKSRIGGARGD